MGFCYEDMPELYTSFIFEEVASWVRTISSPFRDASFCETDSDDNPHHPYRAVRPSPNNINHDVHVHLFFIDLLNFSALGKEL